MKDENIHENPHVKTTQTTDDAYERRRQYLREERRRKRLRKLKIIRAAVIAGLIVVLILIFIVIKSIFGFVASLFHKDTVEADAQATIESQTYTASILTGGDIVLHSPFYDSTTYLTEEGTYDFSPVFTYMKDTYKAADLTVLDLEAAITEDYFSGYPLFRTPETILPTLSENGVDMVLFANNHIYDAGDSGLKSTISALEKYSMPYMGIKKDKEASAYSIQDINGIKVGMFDYTYETGTIDQKAINGIEVTDESSDLINSFNYDDLDTFYDTISSGIQEMKKDGAEYLIAYIHWGTEYQTEESTYQQEMAQKLCDLGIDALIASHPHVIQPIDLFTSSTGDHKMICCYSLGNHLSNQRQELMDSMPTGHTEDGYMVELTLEQTDDDPVSLTEVQFIPTWVYKNISDGNAEYYIFRTDAANSYEDIVKSLNITDNLASSLGRTQEIIGEGSQKVQEALPISAGN